MREWNPKRPEVPVDNNGNWLDWAGYSHGNWEEVEPFFATMLIDGIRTGRSSKKVILRDAFTGKSYPMFVADLVKGIQQGDLEIIEGGRIVATWTASKRGANYGIRAVSKDV